MKPVDIVAQTPSDGKSRCAFRLLSKDHLEVAPRCLTDKSWS